MAASALTLATLATACGGGEADDAPVDTSVDATVPTKGAPLNSCTSVIGGGRPSPGVTIPRCIPTTTVKK